MAILHVVCFLFSELKRGELTAENFSVFLFIHSKRAIFARIYVE